MAGTHDLSGIALFALSAVTGLYWLTSAGHHFSWVSTPSVLLVALSLAAFGMLIWHERRHASPFLPIDLLRQKAIAFSLITTALFAACMFAMVFFLPIYLQLGHRVTAFHSGLLLLPLTAGMVIGSMTAVSRTLSMSHSWWLRLSRLPQHWRQAAFRECRYGRSRMLRPVSKTSR